MILEEIQIPYVEGDLKFERNHIYKNKRIIIHDDYLEYEIDYTCERPIDDEDLGMGWDEVRCYWKTCIDKNSIQKHEVSCSGEIWLYVIHNASGEYTKVIVNSRKEATEIYNKINNWKYEQKTSKGSQEESQTEHNRTAY